MNTAQAAPTLPELPEIGKGGCLLDMDGNSTQYYTAEQMRDYAIAAMRQAVPDGWKLVPIEPTPEWIAGLERSNGDADAVEMPNEAIAGCIRELLAAAPIFGQAKEPTT